MIRLFALPVITLLVGILINTGTPKSEYAGYHSLKFPEQLPGAFTGGFGEPTCRSCHFDYKINPPGGNLSVSGIGEEISPGVCIGIQITVKRKDIGKAGFQISARHPDGRQAGQFKIADNDRLIFTEAVPDSLQYVQHSAIGTKPTKAGRNTWAVIWLAPSSTQDTVIFNIAANAANGDQSVFGDYIYEREIKVKLLE